MPNLNTKIKDKLALTKETEIKKKVEAFKAKYPEVIDWFCGEFFEGLMLQSEGDFTFRTTYKMKPWRWDVVMGLPFREKKGTVVDIEGLITYLQSQGFIVKYLNGGDYEASLLTVKLDY